MSRDRQVQVGAIQKIAVVLLVALVSFGVYWWTKPRPGDIPTTELRLRWTGQSQFAGIYWAEDKGIFSDLKLNVRILPGGPGINFMQSVGSGGEEFGIAGAAQILEARDRGLPVVALAIIFQGNPNIFFARRDSGITHPKDWKGKSVAVYYGYDLEYMYRALLEKANLSRDQVREFPATIDMTPFLQGEVDVWAGYKINQPLRAEEQGVDIVRIDPSDYAVDVAGDVLFTTESFLQRTPDIAERMVQAVLRGWHGALSNPEEAVDLVLKYNPTLKRPHEEKMLAEVRKLVLDKEIEGRIGWMTPHQWQEMLELWKRHGGVGEGIRAADAYDARFVHELYEKEPSLARQWIEPEVERELESGSLGREVDGGE